MVHAQGATMGRSSFGVLGGLNLAKLSGDDITDAENRNGFFIGAFMIHPLSGNFALQPEIHYTQKGVKFSDEGGDATLKLDYFEIPVLGRLNFPTSSGDMAFHLLAGPAFAFKASCKATVSGGGSEFSSDCDNLTEGNDFKSFDWGVMFGGGLDFKMSQHMLTLGVRYNMGMTDVADQTSAKNRVLSFLLGIGL